jgi:nucleoside-diphosphate-sugar epimerase
MAGDTNGHPMTALVTGATGFVGRRLTRRLVDDGWTVRALVRPTGNATGLEALGVHVVRGDLRDGDAVVTAAAGCDAILHLGARTEADGLLTRRDVEEINVGGTDHAATAAARAGARLVAVSSVSVYGRIALRRDLAEDGPLRPDSPYGRSKVAAEQLLLRRHHQDGLDVVIVRPATVWGPGAASWRGLFETVRDGRFRRFGPGDNRHHLVDVDDLVDGLLLASRTAGITGRVYNLAGPEAITLDEWLALIRTHTGGPQAPTAPAWPMRTYRAADGLAVRTLGRKLPRADRLALYLGDRVFSIVAAEHDLGYAPRFTAADTVGRTASSLGFTAAAGRDPERTRASLEELTP